MHHRYGCSLVLCGLIVLSQALAQSVITTIAGTDWLFPGNGLPAINAPLSGSFGLDIAVDRNGNLYIADLGNGEVMKVGRNGILSVIAGTGIFGATGDGGLAISAALVDANSVAVDGSGNVYIGGFGGDIRKVTTDGIIHTIAGDPFNSGFSGDGGPAVQAQLNAVYGLVVDSAGDIFIADSFNNRIREITTDGIIHTIAGGGSSVADGVPATSAQLAGPSRLALDSAGNLYITDQGADTIPGRIRKVDLKGIITTVAGGGNSLADGVQATTESILPDSVAVDPAGNVYFSDFNSVAIRRVNAQGIISTIAGGGGKVEYGFSGDGGPALQALFDFDFPALAIDASGDIYFADNVNFRVREITPDGKINTVAGNGLYHFSGNNGLAASATLDTPTGIVEDSAGSIYFTEPYMNRIRRIAPDRTISVFGGTGAAGYSGDGGPATSATLDTPMYLAIAPDSSIVPAGSIVFSDTSNCVIRSIDLNGIISTIAGTGSCTYTEDLLPALQSQFFGPAGVAFDGGGDLLIAETEGNRIRGIVATGTNKGLVLTFAGTGTAGYAGDGSIAPHKALLNQPTGLKAFGTGVYFCDTGNNVVRFVDFNSGVISTVAGNGKANYSGDGGAAVKAELYAPTGLIFDAGGDMFIADQNNSLIRKVDTNGVITTFAGTLSSPYYDDGGSPLDAFLAGPGDLFLDSAGNLIFTETVDGRVREILTAPPTHTFQLNPTQLAFTAAAGSQPQDQGVDLTSLISGSPVTISTTRTATWLSVSFPSAQLPASLRVIADPSSLAAGTYQGTVTIASRFANPSNYTIPVTLTVTAAGAPSLSVSPNGLTFAFVQQAAAATRPVVLSNVGGGSLPFTASSKTSSGGSWLHVSPSSGTLAAFGSTPLNVTADPTGLAPGTYSGVTIVSTDASTTTIPVTMTVSAVSQTILIPQTGLSFFAVQGGGAPPFQSFNILNTGSGIMPWTISSSTISGGQQWLSTFPASGQTDASVNLVPQVNVFVDPSGLNAGTYFGTVKINAPGATNNPQFVSIVLTVLPAGSQIGPIVQPTGLIFAGVQGAEAPGAQDFLIQSTSSAPVNFTSSQATIGGFTTLPTAGTITPTQQQEIVVQPDLGGLAPGVYRGGLTLSFSDGSTRTVSLVEVVIPSGSALPRAHTSPACKPTLLAPVFTQVGAGSSVVAGFPSQVSVSVIDDCANPMMSGGVTVSFNNGDTIPVRLTSLNNGNWAGTWTPQHPAAQVLIKATATIPAQNLMGQVQIQVGQQAGLQAPVISSGGVVNAASFAAQAPLAPGSLVSLFGTNLAQSQASAGSLPLPTNLGGASVQFGSTTVPLLFSSTGQVNAIIPYGMAVNTTQQVFVSLGASLSVPEPITMAGAAPGVFTVDGQQGIVFDGANIANPANPAKAGDVLVIYCTGLGEVSPSVIAGTPAPAAPLSNTVNTVTATMGGVAAPVQFAGLTPGFAGLYQVNAMVPAGVTGQVPLVLTAAGQSSAAVNITIR